MAFPAKALTTVAFALLSEPGKRILLRIFIAYHDALVGQTRFETEARSKRQLAYPSFIKFVRDTAGIGEDDAVIANKDHAEEEVKKYE